MGDLQVKDVCTIFQIVIYRNIVGSLIMELYKVMGRYIFRMGKNYEGSSLKVRL
jgi:hypothetical protein